MEAKLEYLPVDRDRDSWVFHQVKNPISRERFTKQCSEIKYEKSHIA